MRKPAAALAALSLGAALLVSGPPTANAAQTCDYGSATVAPSKVTIDLDPDQTVVTVRASATGCSPGEVSGQNLFWVICGEYDCSALVKMKRTPSVTGPTAGRARSDSATTSRPGATRPTSTSSTTTAGIPTRPTTWASWIRQTSSRSTRRS